MQWPAFGLTEEDIIDELHGNCFADPTGQSLDDSAGHKSSVSRALRTPYQCSEIYDDAGQQNGSTAIFEVHGHGDERSHAVD